MSNLSEGQIRDELKHLKGWQLIGNYIKKDFEFSNFREAMSIMLRISYEAEDLNHHPEWFNVYNKLNISLSTHDTGGVTKKDIELAERIESIIK